MKTTTSQPFRFLPTTRAEMDERGWDQCDVILVNGDAYIDSPSLVKEALKQLQKF